MLIEYKPYYFRLTVRVLAIQDGLEPLTGKSPHRCQPGGAIGNWPGGGTAAYRSSKEFT